MQELVLTRQGGDGLLERDWGKPSLSRCGEGENEEQDCFAVPNWDVPSWLDLSWGSVCCLEEVNSARTTLGA